MRGRLVAGLAAVVLGLGLILAMAGSASGVVLDGHFVDDNGHPFEDDINAIAEAGITFGCDARGNRFCPYEPVGRGAMAAFIRRALELPPTDVDYFIDDNGSIFQGDINAIAEAGITRGCNPPQNDRFCPFRMVDRGAMAAFLARALQLPTSPSDHFSDDSGSIFELEINALAEAGITRGCGPGLYCPTASVNRGQMAAFLRRSLDLPSPLIQIPMSDHPAIFCDKEGDDCSITIDLNAGQNYSIDEGVFQVLPASDTEMASFMSNTTGFALTVNGANYVLLEAPVSEEEGVARRQWQSTISFEPGNHTLVALWRWDGQVLKTSRVTIRAG